MQPLQTLGKSEVFVRGSSLTQPLISRPAYGEVSTVAESKLPGGGPSDKGLPVDSGIPGSATYAKPEDDVREFDHAKDEPIYRTDNADDLLTKRDRIDTREDNADKHDGFGYWDKGEPEQRSPKTKYPYRDGIPNAHSASAEFVVGLWRLATAHALTVAPDVQLKVASRPEEVLAGLNPKFSERAKKCSVATKRADIKNLRWIFSVDCGNGSKVVKLKGFRDRSPNITKLSKMDLDLACSCQAWRWLGPEHHAKREDYLDGKPRGTASVPVIRDPRGVNRVCKHVAAVMSHTKKWDIAKKK
jgi:hypothetical protein